MLHTLGEWFLTHYNDHVKQRYHPDVNKRPLECTVEPGDILFVPHGWWHCVLNLDDGMSVGLTQNYVSKSNLPDVLRFLETKQQQISGCRDRSEAIQPENLLEEFRNRLRECRPQLLVEAQKLADSGWHCAAWNDGEKSCDDKHDEKLVHKKKKLKKGNPSIVQQAKTSSKSNGIEKACFDSPVDSTGFTFAFL